MAKEHKKKSLKTRSDTSSEKNLTTNEKNLTINEKNLTINEKSSIKKTKGKSEKQYTLEQLKSALDALGEGHTLREVAAKFSIPKSTLHSKLTYKLPIECKKGPSTTLSSDEETDIANWVLDCQSRGFIVTKTLLLDYTQQYLNKEERVTKFMDNRPGKNWYNAFLRRHSNLNLKIAQKVPATEITEELIRKWFTYINGYFQKKNIKLSNPECIFNLDVMSIDLVPKGNAKSNEKTCLTVLFTASATGKIAPPMILSKSKNLPKKEITAQIPQNWSVGYTEKKWMTAESIECYLKNVFVPWLKKNRYKFPVILFVGNLPCYFNLSSLKFCETNQIELLALFPGSTHIIQPLDVEFFHSLKIAYKKTLQEWRIDNNVTYVKKSMLAPVLKLTLDSCDFTEAIKNGFKACGLFPFDPNAVKYDSIFKKRTKIANRCIFPFSETESTNKFKELITLFEAFIPSNSLEAFKKNEHEESWNGDIREEALFECWRKIRSGYED